MASPLKFDSPYLESLNDRILVYDGAMGTQLQERNLTPEDFGGKDGANDYLCLTRPDVVASVHRAYFEAGADVVETNTFGSTPMKLGEYGLEHLTHQQNVAAGRLARAVAEEFSTPARPRFVAGSLGPTGMLPSTDDPSLGNVRFDELADQYRRQALGLIDGGVDLLLIETMQDLLEVKAAINGIRRAFAESGTRLPIQAQVSLDPSGRMLLGNDIGSVYWTLDALGVDVVGLNCSTGPDLMRDAIRYLGETGRFPVSCIPNAGLPINRNGRAFYPMEPAPMSELLRDFAKDYGVNIVGGCCGTSPAHIRAFAAAVEGLKPKRRWANRPDAPRKIFAASAMRAVALQQPGTITMIGERLNTQGSKAVKTILLEDRYADLVPIARQQVEKGAHLLDVCVALTERTDEAEQMRRAVKLLAQSVETPLVIDSTEANVVETALKQYGGTAVINSINLENGRERIDSVVPLAVEHGASLIALTIDRDEGGMAKTADVKLKVARKIHDIVVGEYGIEPGRLIFDALTFTLATGEEEFRNSAVETIEGIRRIKAAMPGVLTTLGVSNVSFGLGKNARPVLNSVFLHHCQQAGLDTAIINPAHITPYFEIDEDEREIVDDLIYNRRPDALERLIAHFDEKGEAPVAAKPEEAIPWNDPEGLKAVLHYKILHRKGEDAEKIVDALVQNHGSDPVELLNRTLLPAMKEVGDKFGAGELILPFVLQSAEVMKKSIGAVEKYLDRLEGVTKGRVVLATVFGDVHDIGKNLVGTILSNNGYTVYDLGKQVPVQTILNKAKEVNATAIGLSALLVSTSRQMPACVRELHHQGLGFPVIIGGAAINRSFGRRTMFVGEDEQDDTLYAPGVFYAKDAFEGLSIMESLVSAERPRFVDSVKQEAVAQRARERAHAHSAVAVEDRPKRSAIADDNAIPVPPHLGWRVTDTSALDLREIWRFLDKNELFRVGWGAKGTKGEAWEKLLREEFEPRLAELQELCLRDGILEPRIITGFYPAQSDGDALLILDPADTARELVRFTFPRQSKEPFLCLSDYVASIESGRMDHVCMQVVTVGKRATELCDAWNAEGEYSKALYLHGLATETAEAMAAWNHHRIRRDWGIGPKQGNRYSFGYSACPELADQRRMFDVLPAEKELGLTLTDHFQIVPEQSTSAIIFHHPECTYYVV